MRYERKYRIEDATYEEVLQIIRMHPASFQRTYKDRFVNTLYLDTPGFDFFGQNAAKAAKRLKPRIRWYGRDWRHAFAPSLELKVKKDTSSNKQLTILPEFTIDEQFNFIEYARENLDDEFSDLIPVVLVRYERSYYQSANTLVRLTIDRNVVYYPVNTDATLSRTPYPDEAIIMEIKYVTAQDSDLDFITQFIPYRLSKNSKYAQAVLMCY
jgi:SPX domain protein involved in polyphosphate accumulation